MYKETQIIELEISDTADKGRYFGRLPSGIAVFVRGNTTLGDIVKARISKVKKNCLEAHLIEILRASGKRVKPPCRFFGICGGCKWQNLSYSAQLDLKRKQVKDALERIGKFKNPSVCPPLPAEEQYGYRNKIEYSFSDIPYRTETELDKSPDSDTESHRFALGLHAAGCPSKAIDIDGCLLVTPEMNSVLRITRNFLLGENKTGFSFRTCRGFLRTLMVRQSHNTGDLMVNLITSSHDRAFMERFKAKLLAGLGEARLTALVNNVTKHSNAAARGEKEYIIHGTGYIEERLGGFSYRVSANSFFQTNTRQAELLYSKILEMAQLKRSEIAYDLFCGTGTISIFAAQKCHRILGMEKVKSAVEDANANAKTNQISNCSFEKQDLRELGRARFLLEKFGLPDVVLCDPPRAGLHPDTIYTIRELAPDRIVYTSCNSATLARDLRLISEDNAYTLVKNQPVDLFPQTDHIESISLLRRS